jgi:uncharacterized protein YjbI with pentapeptide repeats
MKFFFVGLALGMLLSGKGAAQTPLSDDSVQQDQEIENEAADESDADARPGAFRKLRPNRLARPVFSVTLGNRGVLMRNFDGIRFVTPNWEGFRLRGNSFRETKIEEGFLKSVDLRESDFSKAQLSGVILTLARMDHAIFREAKFFGVKAGRVHCHSCDFNGANLWGSDLAGSDFSGADFRGADLSRVNWISTIFKGAKIDSKTKLPIAKEKALAMGFVWSEE